MAGIIWLAHIEQALGQPQEPLAALQWARQIAICSVGTQSDNIAVDMTEVQRLQRRDLQIEIEILTALVEPLSPRELEILTLIAAGLPNRDIANELILFLPTIIWHASNSYGKMGVHNRTTAVVRARELRSLSVMITYGSYLSPFSNLRMKRLAAALLRR